MLRVRAYSQAAGGWTVEVISSLEKAGWVGGGGCRPARLYVGLVAAVGHGQLGGNGGDWV